MHSYPMTEDEKPRDIQVDGLRGLLALGVMTYHYFAIRHLIINGELEFGRMSSILRLLGTWTVPIFFAITAFLFSQRLIWSENRQGRSTAKFLFGRLFRLIPTSLLACLLFLLTNLLVYTDMRDSRLLLHNWNVLMNAALSSIRHPASGPDSEQLSSWAWGIACGPQWTLHFEWMFYILIATLSFVSFSKKSILVPLIAIGLFFFLMDGSIGFVLQWDWMMWAFIPGLLLGISKPYWMKFKLLSHPITAIIAISAVLASAFYDKLKVKIPANTLFLAIVLSNNTATRFLESKLLRSIGETTYSVYLLHGLVQYVTLKWIVTIPIARSMPEWLWWMTCALQVIFIVIIGRLSFEYVEKPGIEAGKRFYAWLMNLIERRAKWLLNWI
jgi:peptidoglycan/LPS O-acetylase OafA/YrhL